MKKGQSQYLSDVIASIAIVLVALFITTTMKAAVIGEVRSELTGGRIDSDLISILNSNLNFERISKEQLIINPTLKEITVLEAIKMSEISGSDETMNLIEKEITSTLSYLNQIYPNDYTLALTAVYPSGITKEFIQSPKGRPIKKVFQTGEVEVITETGILKITLEVGI